MKRSVRAGLVIPAVVGCALLAACSSLDPLGEEFMECGTPEGEAVFVSVGLRDEGLDILDGCVEGVRGGIREGEYRTAIARVGADRLAAALEGGEVVP